MTITFFQVMSFMLVLLGCALGLVVPFIVYLILRDRREMANSEKQNALYEKLGASCHTFQRDMNQQTMNAFKSVVESLNRNSEALVRNSEALRDFERLRGSVRT